MSLQLLVLPMQYRCCRITKGIPKRRLPHGDPTFDVRNGQSLYVVLKQHLGIADNDARLIFNEARTTRRSVYYSGYHPDFGSFEVKRAL